MLAEIFMLRLEAAARAARKPPTARGSSRSHCRLRRRPRFPTYRQLLLKKTPRPHSEAGEVGRDIVGDLPREPPAVGEAAGMRVAFGGQQCNGAHGGNLHRARIFGQ